MLDDLKSDVLFMCHPIKSTSTKCIVFKKLLYTEDQDVQEKL